MIRCMRHVPLDFGRPHKPLFCARVLHVHRSGIFRKPTMATGPPSSSSEHVVNMTNGGGQDRPTETGKTVPKYHLPMLAQFSIGVAGIFFFYLIYGYVQELFFREPERKPFGWYLTLVQFACYTLLASVEMKWKGCQPRSIPLKTYVFLAFLTVGTMGMSNSSVGYLNYPTQVIFKCCKLIPVMIGGVLIQGKKYGPIDVSAALCMSVGLIFFILADSTVSPNFNHTGILMISTALCADAVIGNVQEKAMKTYEASNNEVVLYSYAIGFFYILFYLFVNGNLFSSFWFFYEHPTETYGYAFLYGLSGFFGVSFVLSMIRTFGALMTVTVTTCRKAVTIVLSFVFFTKPFTMQYVWSGLLVLLGIFLNVYSKNRHKINNLLSDSVRRLIICLQQRESKVQHQTMEV
ncbi:LOW QUALITY PROTEIN: adenosine 3'-phospho 5'-phosphosulfate transporter 2-like [Acanthaster planci]|uniref:Adenosine 3'-phospho 5'-phosphosulfate transporter 2 n=1 Tax=Acanthaster planci TaxID=133434 RepID=A0A8B7Y8G8_ACAPL|nr:LOW QUALITY PROTEIN: adenosine 3'-phospho 5'-phosphosulfate transporter 2-like [Acanthaster planci]